jgi:hypothetical protein
MLGVGANASFAAGDASGADRTSSNDLEIVSCVLKEDRVKAYEHIEIDLVIKGVWDNPYNSEETAIVAEIQTPSGKDIRVPGFYFRDYTKTHDGVQTVLQEEGEPFWKIRFTPTETGAHDISVFVSYRGKKTLAKSFAFECSLGEKSGFIRVSPRNKKYYAFDDGKVFFPIGNHFSTPHHNDTAHYFKALSRFARHGGNLIRPFLSFSRWMFNLKSQDLSKDCGKTGLGYINLEAAWWFEQLLERCEKLGMYVMVCFIDERKHPKGFLTDEDAKKYVKRHMDYCIARWGHSTNVFCWQLSNEVNNVKDFEPNIAATWHSEMARHIKQIDPYGHIVQSNNGWLNGHKEIYTLPEMEVISTNMYYSRDGAYTADWTRRTFVEKYNKPYLLTEYGPCYYYKREVDPDPDPTGIHLHNNMWGQTVTGASGAGMAWWWERWIDKNNLYPLYKVLAEFVKDIPFDRYKWQPVEIDSFSFVDESIMPSYGSTFVNCWYANFRPDPLVGELPVFKVASDGTVSHINHLMARVSKGSGNFGPKTFLLTMPTDGECTVFLPERSEAGNPVLKASLDNNIVLEERLGQDYYKSYSFEVPEGEQTIHIENTGDEWFTFALSIENHRICNGPDLQVRGLMSSDWILVWLRNPKYNILYDKMKIKPVRQPPGKLVLNSLSEGDYKIRWIDTGNGKIIKEDDVEVNEDRKLECITPSVEESAACLIKRKGC